MPSSSGAPLFLAAALVALVSARLSAQSSTPLPRPLSLPGDLPDAAVAERIADGDRLLSARGGAAAFSAYADAVARSGTKEMKSLLRDKFLAMGSVAPAPISDVEKEGDSAWR